MSSHALQRVESCDKTSKSRSDDSALRHALQPLSPAK
jgi:hypothetical protein